MSRGGCILTGHREIAQLDRYTLGTTARGRAFALSDMLIAIALKATPMAQLLIRGLDPALKEKLRRRAVRTGSSMESEARAILLEALRDPHPARVLGFGSAMLQCFAGSNAALDFEIPELRGSGLMLKYSLGPMPRQQR